MNYNNAIMNYNNLIMNYNNVRGITLKTRLFLICCFLMMWALSIMSY